MQTTTTVSELVRGVDLVVAGIRIGDVMSARVCVSHKGPSHC
jgi:hypothetical protein